MNLYRIDDVFGDVYKLDGHSYIFYAKLHNLTSEELAEIKLDADYC